MILIPISKQKREQVINLYACGFFYANIVEIMGISYGMIVKILAKAREDRDPRAKFRYKKYRSSIKLPKIVKEKEKLLKEVRDLSLHWSAVEISAWTGLRLATIMELRKVHNIPHMSHVEANRRSKSLWRRMWPRHHQFQTVEAIERWKKRNVRSSQTKSMARDKCEAV